MAATITENMLNGLRSHIVDMAQSARYMIDGAWHTAEIEGKAVQTNGSVFVSFYVTWPEGSTLPATKFQVLNGSGAVLAERTEEVPRLVSMDALLYRFRFGVNVSE